MRTGRPPTHGHSTMPEYRVWIGMKRRCFNPRAVDYQWYGGRGIRVCERWRLSFEAFLADVGPRPTLKHSLDRYPNRDGNYEPGNVRWATAIEQAHNRDYAQMRLTFQGVTRTVAEWANHTGIRKGTITSRLSRGASVAHALTAPILTVQQRAAHARSVPRRSRERLPVEIQRRIATLYRQGKTLWELSAQFSVCSSTVWNYVHKHKNTSCSAEQCA